MAADPPLGPNTKIEPYPPPHSQPPPPGPQTWRGGHGGRRHGAARRGRDREPPRIRRLEESMVNRIAAGKVIQQPPSAVKELVENSIDTGSSTISVTVKDGGVKLIQVSDDSDGIRCEDLSILCERHTTSKLSAYEDLQTIKSTAFRGEALASMTYVGHVIVTTIKEGQLHGYRVSYRDGVMENDPKPCVAVKGTQIMVERGNSNHGELAAFNSSLREGSATFSWAAAFTLLLGES
ncbi:DNA mismatch repair protein MLH1 [Hordeum vulgare]|nr:DNA mismatch repair protein MLH1 [Hordeum vulgare]